MSNENPPSFHLSQPLPFLKAWFCIYAAPKSLYLALPKLWDSERIPWRWRLNS